MEQNHDLAGWTTLARHLAGDPSVDAEMRRWLAADPRRVAPAAELERAWSYGPSRSDAPVDAFAALAVVTKRLGLAEPLSGVAPRHPPRRYSMPRVVTGVAAAALAIATFAVGTRHWTLWRSEPATSQEYRTANGQRATVQLDDGTRVVLGPATSLRVTHRSVQLTGEALFIIAHQSRDPFVVIAGATKTTVLGTQFSVRAYDSDVTVAVREGRVRLNDVVLGARDVGRTKANGTPYVQRNQPVDALLAFADGKLVLHDVTLADAIPDLNRWYDADIRLADPSLGTKSLQTTLGVGSRNDLAAILEFIFRARVVRQGRTITLYSR